MIHRIVSVVVTYKFPMTSNGHRLYGYTCAPGPIPGRCIFVLHFILILLLSKSLSVRFGIMNHQVGPVTQVSTQGSLRATPSIERGSDPNNSNCFQWLSCYYVLRTNVMTLLRYRPSKFSSLTPIVTESSSESSLHATPHLLTTTH